MDGQDHEKLNQAYLYGNPGDGFHYWDDPSAGPGLEALTLNVNFGVKVDHYIAVNMKTFVKMVDAVDGIDVTLNGIAATGNKGNGAEVTGVCTNVVHVDGGEFSNNSKYGLKVVKATYQEGDTAPSFSNNGSGGLFQDSSTCVTSGGSGTGTGTGNSNSSGSSGSGNGWNWYWWWFWHHSFGHHHH